MKQLLSFLFLASTIQCSAQNSKIIKYFDSSWWPTDKFNAYYFTEITKSDDLYLCNSYWAKSGKLNCKSIFKDTLFQQPAGLLVRFYESGKIQDSMIYERNGDIKELFHYYEDGKLWAHCVYKSKKENCKGYDQKGALIEDFVYKKEAEFPDGLSAWSEYLENAIQSFNPAKKGAPVGKYKVVIKFVIDENGKTILIEPITNVGYGMEEKAVQVIRKSPKWSPMIYLGKLSKAYRLQPLTFIVANE